MDDDSIHTDRGLDEQDDDKSIKKNLKPSTNNQLLDSAVTSPNKTVEISESLVKDELLNSTLGSKKKVEPKPVA